MILKKQKNFLLGLVQECGLDPSLFTAEDDVTIGGKDYFVVSVRDSPIVFAVRPCSGKFEESLYRCSQFREGFPLTGETYSGDWQETLANGFKEWLAGVVRPYLDDAATPDMWELLKESGSQARMATGTPEEFGHFTDEEKQRIRLSINEFRLVIINDFGPTKDQIKAIDDRLKYLSEALDKHNRFDWKGIAIQTTIAIIVALSLDTDQGAKLFHLFTRIFSNVLYLLR
jgi:hypothetical protein